MGPRDDRAALVPGAGPASCQALCAADSGADEAAIVEAFEAAKAAAGLGFASPLVGALVLGNTLLGGTGLLGIPHAFSACGYAIGAVLLVIFGLLSAFGCHLLSCAARKTGRAPCSFYSVAGAVAPRWTWLIDTAVMLKCFGVATSYLIIVGDLAPSSVRHMGVKEARRWHVVIVGFLVAGSLACLRNLSALRYTAVGSVLIIVWSVVLFVLYLADVGPEFDPCAEARSSFLGAAECDRATFEPFAAGDALALMKALPVFIFTFTCQQNVFTICNEVRNATRRRIDGAIVVAYSTAWAAFLSAAVCGYATYGDQVDGDVLKGYPSKMPVEVTRLLFSLLAVFSYPLQVHPCRVSAAALVSLARSGAAPGAQIPCGWFYLLTFLILAASLAIALTVRDLGLVLGVVGATGSTAVSYILPGILYAQAYRTSHLKRKLALAQAGLGCVIMPTCLVVVFL